MCLRRPAPPRRVRGYRRLPSRLRRHRALEARRRHLQRRARHHAQARACWHRRALHLRHAQNLRPGRWGPNCWRSRRMMRAQAPSKARWSEPRSNESRGSRETASSISSSWPRSIPKLGEHSKHARHRTCRPRAPVRALEKSNGVGGFEAPSGTQRDMTPRTDQEAHHNRADATHVILTRRGEPARPRAARHLVHAAAS